MPLVGLAACRLLAASLSPRTMIVGAAVLAAFVVRFTTRALVRSHPRA